MAEVCSRTYQENGKRLKCHQVCSADQIGFGQGLLHTPFVSTQENLLRVSNLLLALIVAQAGDGGVVDRKCQSLHSLVSGGMTEVRLPFPHVLRKGRSMYDF